MYEADLIFVNGHVLTMDEQFPSASAVVVKNSTILYVGNNERALTWRGKETDVVDVKGKTMMPGFIESHIHPTQYGLNLLELDCRPVNTPSIEAILEKVSEAVGSTPMGEWIRGWGWDDSQLRESRHPTRWDLDKIAPHHPVFLKRTCGHMGVANTKALELSNLTSTTKDPQGGHMERETEAGKLTGLLQEKALGMIAVPDYKLSDAIKGMKLAQQDFARWGITTVHDMSMQSDDLKVYQQLLEQEKLTVRVRPWVWAVDQNGRKGLLDEVISLGVRSGFGNDMIKIQGMKFMLDGSVGGRTAAVQESYEFDDSKGILYNSSEEVVPLMRKSLASGLRVAVHAIGERAIEVAITSLEKASEPLTSPPLRNRIEHCALPTNDHLTRMKKLKLIAASSVGFLYHIGDSYRKNLGPERMKRVYPHRSFKKYGIIAPGNSDLPVTGGNPWTGIYGAVTRKSKTGKRLDEEQNISVYDALKAYTKHAAFSSFEEKVIGVLKPSAKADIIIISDDPFATDDERLKDIKVESTYLGGDLIYDYSWSRTKGLE